ncbi:MAG: ACP S-malonyltransferase, partial [Candidatus Thermoplasmatota archaeon]|nr:ACP S-malonyltransferase [Candidatus Thermoplasmatota archaeon]
EVDVEDPGGLVAMRCDEHQAQDLIEGLQGWPANINGPEQTVVAGTTQSVQAMLQRAEEAGVQATALPVSAAFHSPIVAPATEPLGRVLGKLPFDPPAVPVIANVTGEPYPDDPDAARQLLAEQVASPVRWVETMQALQQRGTRLIVECGPKRALSGLALANLDSVDAVPTAHPRTGAKAQLTQALTLLAAHGHLPAPEAPEPPAPHRAGTAGGRPSRSQLTTGDRQARPALGQPLAKVVVSGISLGLPGTQDPFAPANLDHLLAGENRIQQVPGRLKQQMANMGITRLIKDAPGGPTLAPIQDADDVVQLAGQATLPNLKDYDVHEDWLESADATAHLAVAAALEALTDANIPLVREQRTTRTGTTLEGGWVLPEPLQAT